MVLADVVLETVGSILLSKVFSCLVSDEAVHFGVFLDFVVLRSEVCKCVDDDTKNNTDQEDDDHQEGDVVKDYSLLASINYLKFGCVGAGQIPFESSSSIEGLTIADYQAHPKTVTHAIGVIFWVMQAQNANQDISDYEHESDRQADGVSQIPNGLQHTEQSKGSPYYIYNVADVKELVYKNTKYRQNKQPDKYLIKISVKILKQQLKTIANIFKKCAFLSCVANY